MSGILAYARFSKDAVAFVVANPSKQRKQTKIEYKLDKKAAFVLKAKDLMTGKSYRASVSENTLSIDAVRIEGEDVAVIMAEL